MTELEAELAVIFGDGMEHGEWWAGQLPVTTNEGKVDGWTHIILKDSHFWRQCHGKADLLKTAAELAPLSEWVEYKR
jgi:hypothetical protein